MPGGRRELFGWAVREGLTNVLRHSGARRCRITLTADAVAIADDGRGPDDLDLVDSDLVDLNQVESGRHHSGVGLIGLRERAAPQGAAVTVSRSDLGGFGLRVGW